MEKASFPGMDTNVCNKMQQTTKNLSRAGARQLYFSFIACENQEMHCTEVTRQNLVDLHKIHRKRSQTQQIVQHLATCVQNIAEKGGFIDDKNGCVVK